MSKVFVGGLTRTIGDDFLRETFSQCGTVVEASVALDRKGRSRGYGFVTFARPEGARRAIDTLHGTVVEGNAVRVGDPMSGMPKTSSAW